MRVGVLFSGGKDSVLSTWKAMKEHKVVVLITMKSINPDSYMFHVPAIDITRLQSESMGIPQIFIKTEGKKEDELRDLKEAIKQAKEKYDIDGIVSGAIASNYQKSRIEKVCGELDLESITPLWHKQPKTVLLDLINGGFKTIFVKVAAEGLNKEWLGKEINLDSLKKLERMHDTCYTCNVGEGGEFESLVLDGPIFMKKIVLKKTEKKWDGMAGELIIKNAILENKS